MDKHARELEERLRERIASGADDAVAEMIREARDEALADARAVLKGLMLDAILERALVEFGGAASVTAARGEGGEPNAGTSAPPVHERSMANEAKQETAFPLETGGIADQGDEAVRREIEAIRQQLVDNDRMLRQIKAPPEEVEGAEPDDRSSCPTQGRDGDAYYVYGIIERKGKQPSLPEHGIASDHPVCTVSHGDIQALVSVVPLREFGEEALRANVENHVWLEEKVLFHQSVLASVLTSHTVLPMTFCTIYQSEERVQAMLAERHDDFLSALERLCGRQEWGVKLTYDRERLSQHIAQSSDKVRTFVAELQHKPNGAAYFARKKQEGIMEEEVERLCDECAQCTHDRLAGRAEAAIIGPLRSMAMADGSGEMLLNGAYLVAEREIAVFQAELQMLEEAYGGLGFSYAMIGPWPPYNFVGAGDGDEPARG